MNLIVAAAMREELLPFHQYYETTLYKERGKTKIERVSTVGIHQLFLVETGIGKVNAAAASSLICEMCTPDVIINTGTAGGLSREIRIGDVVFATRLGYSDVDATGFHYAYGQVPQMPPYYELEKEIVNYFDCLSDPTDYRIHAGGMVTSDSFMSRLEVVKKIKDTFPQALASDMESTALAQVASFYRIPVLNVRGISDIAGEEAATAFEENLHLASRHAFQQTQNLVNLFLQEAE